MFQKICIFIIIIIFLPLYAQNTFIPTIHIESMTQDYTYYVIRDYFLQTFFELDKIYKLSSPNYDLNITIDDKAKSNVIKYEQEEHTLFATTNKELFISNQKKFEKSLIISFLLMNSSVPPEYREQKNIDWVIDGTQGLLYQQRKALFNFQFEFPIVNELFQKNGKINVDEIINCNFSSLDGVLIPYYSELSQILLNSILDFKNGNKFIFEYIQISCQHPKINRVSLFNKLLEEYQKDFELDSAHVTTSFNSYLNKKAKELSINAKMPLSPNNSEIQFNNIINIEKLPNEKDIKIEDLASYLKNKKNKDRIIIEKITQLQELILSSNFLLKIPMQKMIGLLYELQENKDYPEDQFKVAMNNYIADFNEKVLILEEIDQYLYQIENEKINIGTRYYLYLQEMKNQQKLIHTSWPELEKFLDQNYPMEIK